MRSASFAFQRSSSPAKAAIPGGSGEASARSRPCSIALRRIAWPRIRRAGPSPNSFTISS